MTTCADEHGHTGVARVCLRSGAWFDPGDESPAEHARPVSTEVPGLTAEMACHTAPRGAVDARARDEVFGAPSGRRGRAARVRHRRGPRTTGAIQEVSRVEGRGLELSRPFVLPTERGRRLSATIIVVLVVDRLSAAIRRRLAY